MTLPPHFIIDIDGFIIALTADACANNSPAETPPLAINCKIDSAKNLWEIRGITLGDGGGGAGSSMGACIPETDVAVRHVLEMIARVITPRYWRSRPRAILRPDASSRRRQFAHRRSKCVIEKRIRQARPPYVLRPTRNRANNAGRSSSKILWNGVGPAAVYRAISHTRAHIRAHIRKYTCIAAAITHATASGTQYANRNSTRGRGMGG